MSKVYSHVIISALILIVITSACVPQTALAKVEITWYVRSQPAENTWERSIVIPQFEAQNPNIKINLVVVASSDFETKLQAMYAAKTPPDVFSHWGQSGWGDYYRRGMVADLTPFIEKDHFDLSDFIPEVLDVFKVDGKIIGLPMFRTGSFVFYNKDLFDAAGVSYPTTNWDDTTWTWSAFIDKCKQLTRKTNDPATTIYGCYLSLWPLDSYPLLFGDTIFPDEVYKTGFTSHSNLSSDASIQAFQAWQDLVWKFGYMPDPAVADSLGGGDIFQSGKVAMVLNGGWGWWNYKGVEKNFHWGVAALPYGTSNRKAIAFADPWLMSSTSLHPNEAWEFIKFLSSKDIQEGWMDTGGVPPARISLLDKWYHSFRTMSPEEVKQVHLGAIKYGVACPCDFMVRYDQIDAFLATTLDPIINNQSQAKDVLPDANSKLDKLLEQIQNDYQK